MIKVTSHRISDNRIGGGSSEEQDHGTKTWPDGDGTKEWSKEGHRGFLMDVKPGV